ncbi:MAG: hypothetical protein L6R41_004962 [Letrouitia leprolyta]|nr:MAG: hypothetical protein L6R41_004962 [Letrouitia leprolyta]
MNLIERQTSLELAARGSSPPASTSMIKNEEPLFIAETIIELATQALRQGMTWTVFRPEHGIFLAEGNGYVLRPKLQQRLEFETIPLPPSETQVSNEVYIPSPLVDKLYFGIIPGYRLFHLPDYRIGTIEEVYATMHSLDPTGSATKKIRDNRHPSFEPKCLFGFSDIIPLAAPMLRHRNSTIIRLPIPAEYTTGLLTHKEGFIIFRYRLDELIASPQYTESPSLPVPEMILWVRAKYHELMQAYPEWEDEVLANSSINNRSMAFLDSCHEAWDHCTTYHYSLITTYGKNFCLDLMAAHLKNAVNYWHQAWNRMRAGTARDHHGLRDYIAEGMHLYWDYLELVVEEMEAREWGDVRREVIREAWVVLIFRGFCWWRCHWMMEGEDMCGAPERLDSEYLVEGFEDDKRTQRPEEGYVVVADG